MPTRLRNLVIKEVSLVDRPANPEARVMLFKRADDDVESGEKEFEKGRTQKGGDAVETGMLKWLHAIGKKLGLTAEEVQHGDEGPAESATSDLTKMYDGMTTDDIMEHEKAMNEFYQLRGAFMRSMDSIMEMEDQEEHAPRLMQSVEQFASKARALIPKMKMEPMRKAASDLLDELESVDEVGKAKESVEKVGRALNKERMAQLKRMRDMLDKMLTDAGDKPMPERMDKGAPPSPTHITPVTKGDDDMADNKGALPEDVTKRLEELEKSASKLEALEKRLGDAETKATEFEKRATEAEGELKKAQERLDAEREIRVSAEFAQKAQQYPHAGDVTKVSAMLRKAYGVSEDYGKELEEMLKSQHEAIEQGDLFKSAGSGRTNAAGGSVYARMEAKAQEIAKAQNITLAKAMDVYIQTPEGKEDYNQYDKEAN